MISCPRCDSLRWQIISRCPLDPANDVFRCEDCQHQYKRYDPKDIQPQEKEIPKGKYTPRPWNVMLQNLRVSPGDPRCPEIWEVPVQWGTGNVIAVVYGNTISGETSKEECLANARLISAAPELLEACLLLTDMCKKLGFDTPSMPGFEKTAYERGLAALRKAKGEDDGQVNGHTCNSV